MGSDERLDHGRDPGTTAHLAVIGDHVTTSLDTATIRRILVTGSRDWDDDPLLCIQLGFAIQDLGGDVTVVHGACPSGADKTADTWCRNHGIPVERHPADWRWHGRAAGPIRNAEMVAAGADLCLAFIKDGSRGATHCAHLAEAAGIPVKRWTA